MKIEIEISDEIVARATKMCKAYTPNAAIEQIIEGALKSYYGGEMKELGELVSAVAEAKTKLELSSAIAQCKDYCFNENR